MKKFFDPLIKGVDHVKNITWDVFNFFSFNFSCPKPTSFLFWL